MARINQPSGLVSAFEPTQPRAVRKPDRSWIPAFRPRSLPHRSTPAAPTKQGIEAARAAMLEVLRRHGDERQLERRIRYAPDLKSLWYLRMNLFSHVQARIGESFAIDELNGIASHFSDHFG